MTQSIPRFNCNDLDLRDAPIVRDDTGQQFRAGLVQVAEGRIEFSGLRAGDPVVQGPTIFIALESTRFNQHITP